MDGCWRQWGRHGIKARYLGWFSHWFVVWCNLRGFMSYSCEIKASHSRSPKSPVQYTYSRQPWLLHTQPFSHTSWCWTISYDESSRCGNAGSETQIAGSIPNHTFRQQWCFLPGMSEMQIAPFGWKCGMKRRIKSELQAEFERFFSPQVFRDCISWPERNDSYGPQVLCPPVHTFPGLWLGFWTEHNRMVNVCEQNIEARNIRQ